MSSCVNFIITAMMHQYVCMSATESMNAPECSIKSMHQSVTSPVFDTLLVLDIYYEGVLSSDTCMRPNQGHWSLTLLGCLGQSP